jgi:hypothetical protein
VTQAPTRAAYFASLVALGKIFTMNNLKKRHVILMDRCCMCKQNGESADYLLLLHAMWLTLCGLLSLRVLVCLGLCLGESLTCLLVGGRLEGRGVLRFGKWCLTFLL